MDWKLFAFWAIVTAFIVLIVIWAARRIDRKPPPPPPIPRDENAAGLGWHGRSPKGLDDDGIT